MLIKEKVIMKKFHILQYQTEQTSKIPLEMFKNMRLKWVISQFIHLLIKSFSEDCFTSWY